MSGVGQTFPGDCGASNFLQVQSLIPMDPIALGIFSRGSLSPTSGSAMTIYLAETSELKHVKHFCMFVPFQDVVDRMTREAIQEKKLMCVQLTKTFLKLYNIFQR